ncbi:site-specific integrase [Pseudonocardia sp. WMMC193]|uniref:tyrosine-type recombinase/integrase n=1 Tax=Pseudonocardia sp. WMMC193 TaxID=2911965 RepID=UPI001F1F11F6|nr:site-specific integrase [Pseudonocardia sp. WMMC193]MCF7547339.1 site-specific integrase [Pseudonocardia sp. WMMC193]
MNRAPTPSETTRAEKTSSGLLEKLLAELRPEFRVEVLLPDPQDPVLGYAWCEVPGCDRPAHGQGLCSGHRTRWRQRRRPPRQEFLDNPGPPLVGRRELEPCGVESCGYARASHGLCRRHALQWQRAERPPVDEWAATAAAVPDCGRRACRLSFCNLWVDTATGTFCHPHTARWRGYRDSTTVEEFVRLCDEHGAARIDFSRLARQIRLEIQYATQYRHDEARRPTPHHVINTAITIVVDSRADSLLDLSIPQWRRLFLDRRTSTSRGRMTAPESFILGAREAVEKLRDGSGWDSEFHRDVWRLSALPGITHNATRSRAGSRLRFDRITQPWLRELTKRWIRWRLASGRAATTVIVEMYSLTAFSEFLAETQPSSTGLGDIDRATLERYLVWLTGQPGAVRTHAGHVLAVQRFFLDIRRHNWDDRLPASAAFYSEDIPRTEQRITRFLVEHVMAQIEQPANLKRWSSPEGRLITIILIRCGLRIADACTLPFDCVKRDGQQAPYLLYRNNKMRREAAVPIDEELEAEIRDQQQRVLQRWPGGGPHLLPRLTANADGARPYSPGTYVSQLNRWVAESSIRDEHGRAVHLTPHQWRHTFATRLINRDVPQEVVRVLLDHESTQMTSHYAKITDQTVRRHWQAATKVDINGRRVALEPDGPLAQAQWAKTRYGLATQTLPNGYCGLPLQRTCPHANACLTCPVFLTGPEFLPELREQRERTLTLIDISQRSGHSRVIEMNRQVLHNLDRMIDGVQNDPQDADDASR